MKQLNRITFNPLVMGGKACIRGMRVTAGMIVGLITTSKDEKAILAAYPYLESDFETFCLNFDNS